MSASFPWIRPGLYRRMLRAGCCDWLKGGKNGGWSMGPGFLLVNIGDVGDTYTIHIYIYTYVYIYMYVYI